MDKQNTVKWMRMLSYAAMASLAASLLNMVPAISSGLTVWFRRAIMLAMILGTYQLRAENGRYQKAASYRVMVLASSLVSTYLLNSSVRTYVPAIFSIMAVYQEYNAHSELVAEADKKLSLKWHNLFYWGMGMGILVSFGTMTASLVAAVTGMDVGTSATILVAVLGIPQVVIDIMYLLYLKKTIQGITPDQRSPL